VKRVMVGCI